MQSGTAVQVPHVVLLVALHAALTYWPAAQVLHAEQMLSAVAEQVVLA